MLTVETYLNTSKIHGIGLFTVNFLPKGTIWWKLNEKFDIIYTEEDLNKLELPSRNQIIEYSYVDKYGRNILCGDQARHVNHSDTPNCIMLDDEYQTCITIIDVPANEELTQNYKEFNHWSGNKDNRLIKLENNKWKVKKIFI